MLRYLGKTPALYATMVSLSSEEPRLLCSEHLKPDALVIMWMLFTCTGGVNVVIGAVSAEIVDPIC